MRRPLLPPASALPAALLATLLVSAWPCRAGDLEELCGGLARRIDAFLGRKFTGPVPVKIVPRTFLVRFARSVQERLIPDGLVDVAQRLAVRLHQVPPGYDLIGKQIEMVRDQMAGIYDPDNDCFYVVEAAGESFPVTAAHELVHAYRDIDTGYWPRLVQWSREDSDRALALSCLVEGDAQFLGAGFGLAAMRGLEVGAVLDLLAQGAAARAKAQLEAAGDRLRELPAVLREMMATRYVVGEYFAARLYEQGGRAALAAAFENPPRSTEQVLHPGKYLGPGVDEPVLFSGGDPTEALGDGWKHALTNTMGEFEIRIHLSALLGREIASAAAEGWDGARYHFCSKDGAPGFFGLVSTWDTARDAAEFAGAWLHWASLRDGAGTVVTPGEDLRVRTGEGLVVVRLSGRDVVVADGVPEARVDAVLAALASAGRRGGPEQESSTKIAAYFGALILLAVAGAGVFVLLRRGR